MHEALALQESQALGRCLAGNAMLLNEAGNRRHRVSGSQFPGLDLRANERRDTDVGSRVFHVPERTRPPA